MRVWIAEGRVSPDSLVWREGWRDWQEAEAVFPQLKTKSPNDAVPEGLSGMIEEQLASPRPITGSHRTTTGGASKGGNLVFIIFAVVVVLLVALVFIFLHVNKRPAKAAFHPIPTAPAAARCPVYPSPIAS